MCTENSVLIDYLPNCLTSAAIAQLCFFLTLFVSPFKLRSRLEAEDLRGRPTVQCVKAEIFARPSSN